MYKFVSFIAFIESLVIKKSYKKGENCFGERSDDCRLIVFMYSFI